MFLKVHCIFATLFVIFHPLLEDISLTKAVSCSSEWCDSIIHSTMGFWVCIFFFSRFENFECEIFLQTLPMQVRVINKRFHNAR